MLAIIAIASNMNESVNNVLLTTTPVDTSNAGFRKRKKKTIKNKAFKPSDILSAKFSPC